MSRHKPQTYRSALKADQRRKVLQIVAYGVAGAILGLLTFYSGVWVERLTSSQSITLDRCVADLQLPTLDQVSK